MASLPVRPSRQQLSLPPRSALPPPLFASAAPHISHNSCTARGRTWGVVAANGRGVVGDEVHLLGHLRPGGVRAGALDVGQGQRAVLTLALSLGAGRAGAHHGGHHRDGAAGAAHHRRHAVCPHSPLPTPSTRQPARRHAAEKYTVQGSDAAIIRVWNGMAHMSVNRDSDI